MDKQLSMVNIAYEVLKQEGTAMNFFDLWDRVVAVKEYDEDEASSYQSLFYTNITLDGRMITLGENIWDLRSRHKFEEVHIDMNDIYSDDETDPEDDEDDGLIEDNYNEQ